MQHRKLKSVLSVNFQLITCSVKSSFSETVEAHFIASPGQRVYGPQRERPVDQAIKKFAKFLGKSLMY